MRPFASYIFVVFVIAVCGCNNERSSVSRSTDFDAEKWINAGLPDIGEPNEHERTLDGILIVGSGLTDEHVAAIRLLTDDKGPTNPNNPAPTRNIQHTSTNSAINIWQTGSMEIFQKLRFEDGRWKVEEEGGGFGNR